jgi:DevC protein
VPLGFTPSVPLGWLQLWHKPLRLLVAVAGIAFAVLLILMQLGFRSALFESTLRFHERFQYDIALFSSESVFIVRPASFTIRRLYEALGSPEVASVSPVYIAPAVWKNPWTHDSRSINAVGVDPTLNLLKSPGRTWFSLIARRGPNSARWGSSGRRSDLSGPRSTTATSRSWDCSRSARRSASTER